MSDYITTYSKLHFYPLEPDREEIRLVDIAHALSLMTRANGHFPVFYSVAQHSMDCCNMAKQAGFSYRVQLACLIHDGSEAYLSDITRPVKKEIPQYQNIESGLQEAIYRKFLGEKLTDSEEMQVKKMDDACLYYEFLHFMGEELLKEKPDTVWIPNFEECSMKEAEKRFVIKAENLLKQLQKAGD